MSTVKAATLQNTGSGAPAFQNSSGTEIGQLAKAWVNFDGTGTVNVRNSFNVSSITDNSTGDYSVNFTNALPNANYSVGGFVHRNGSTSGRVLCHIDLNSTITTTTYRFAVSGTPNGQSVGLNNTDVDYVFCQFFGD